MTVLRDLLELVGNKEMVDICIYDPENPEVPKTLYYGTALAAYARRDTLREVWTRKVRQIYTYIDNPNNEEKGYSVLMIKLRSNDEPDKIE